MLSYWFTEDFVDVPLSTRNLEEKGYDYTIQFIGIQSHAMVYREFKIIGRTNRTV